MILKSVLFYIACLLKSHTAQQRDISSLRSRPKLVYDQTQSSAHPCVPRPKLQGLDGSSSALQPGRWSGDDLIRGNFGLKSLIIGGFERTWFWSDPILSAIGSDHNLFERTWDRSEFFLNAIHSDQGQFRAPYFFVFFWCFLTEMLALSRGNNKAAFWSETNLKSDSSDQKEGVQLIAKAGPLRNFDQLETTTFLMESCLNSSIKAEIYTKWYTKKIVLNRWVSSSLAIFL